jgi:2-polyprenyl-3-methyl-5-hydroxy-6-metoxy-1,4-benzoquinol methylase
MIYNDLLCALSHKPTPYEKTAEKFWDDAHISKSMLEAHLNPENDAASYNQTFIRQAVQWITGLSGNPSGRTLLDLGCGPGLYAGLLADAGFEVTGIDLSPRSLEYARASAELNNRDIRYIQGNYLTTDFNGTYDIVIMISCDFGVMSPSDRGLLLGKIHQTLKPGGLFIFDVHSVACYENRPETQTWSSYDSGFWSPEKHACLYAHYRYDAEKVFADRYIIAEEPRFRCFNIWNHGFSAPELLADLLRAGFQTADFFGDAAGAPLTDAGDVICAVARRKFL